MKLCGLLVLINSLLTVTVSSQDGSRLREAFSRLDTNNDGSLSINEYETATVLKSRLAKADTDGDGILTFEEFARGVVDSTETPTPDPPGGSTSEITQGTQTRAVTVGEVERRYVLFVPGTYDKDVATPVVIAFHGGGGNPESMIRISGLNETSEESGFLVVYPYGSGPDPDRMLTYNGGECCGFAMHQEVDEIGFVNAILDDLGEVAHVDSGAVFATGLSNGGIMSYRVGAEMAHRIAAIAPVGGPLMMESIQPSQPVAVMHFHGTGDKFAPFDGGYGERNGGGRGVTNFRSVGFSLEAWIEANGCKETPVVESLPNSEDDGTRVTRKTWGGGANDTEVVLIEIEGGGHTWPGVTPPPSAAFLGVSTKDISANDLMWEFFQKHRRKPVEETRAEAMKLLRTPDEHFENLPNYDFEARYLYVDDPGLPKGNGRIRMHYTVSGPVGAPTLLLLHGNPSWSYLFRDLVRPINEAGYRTLLIDYVGHGKSDKPAAESDYTYDRHLEWLREAFSQLEEDPDLQLREVVLFGHDYGHPLGARLMAEHYPDRFDGFINGNAGLNRGRWGIANRHDRWRNFVRSVPKVPIGPVICRNPARESLGLPAVPEAEEAGYDAPYPTAEYQASIRAFPEMVPENETWPEAKANQVAWDYLTTQFEKPYLVIWEARDSPDSRNRRDEYISSIPGAFGQENPQLLTGHYSPEDDPESTAASIIQFLDDLYDSVPFRELFYSDFSKIPGQLDYSAESDSYDVEEEALRLTSRGDSIASFSLPEINSSQMQEWKMGFRYTPERTAAGDKLSVELRDGQDWIVIEELHHSAENHSGDFSNHSTDYGFVRQSGWDKKFPQEAQIRFRFESTREDAAVLLREVGIYGRDGTSGEATISQSGTQDR